MVSSYYSVLGIKDKRILSIIGSGDQIIDAYFLGAKEVFGFDINKYASFMLELKVAAIFNLTYLEFIKFFGSNMNNGALDFKLYNHLKKDLSKKAEKFFTKIYQEFDGNGKKLIKSDYFRQRSMMKTSAYRINTFLKNEKSYLRCREIMENKKLQSLELDINDIAISKNLKGKFDIINLSNVLNYLTANTSDSDILKVLDKVIKNVSKRTKSSGAFFYYSYSPSLYKIWDREIPPASRLNIINKIKSLNYFKVVFKKFKGVNEDNLDRINLFIRSENKSGRKIPKTK
jgi:SAM-dependent methyltransferase